MAQAKRQPARLGMDVGGTKTVIVAIGDTGDILAETRLDDWARGRWQDDVDTLAAAARAVLERASAATPTGVGLSVPGPLDLAAGRVIEAPNLPGWVDVPLAESMSEALGAPVVLENDANAAALAEWRFGAGQGARSLLYLTMSTGIGGGLILDGRLYRGATWQAGEVGHMPIVVGGRRCNCGLRGCLEAYASGAGIASIIRDDLGRGEDTALREMTRGRPASARLWAEAVRAGDAYALRLREQFLDRLAHGLAILIPTFDPERIILGTIIARNADLFLDPLIERVRALTWESLHHVELVPARLGDRLPAYAALCAASPEAVPA